MPDRNKTKLIIGFLFIGVSFVCAASILYFLGRANFTDTQKMAEMQVQLSNLMNDKAQQEMSAADAAKVKRDPVDLDDFLAKAESIYGADELNRKEGVLWIDKKASNIMVTLGRVNGLSPGSKLSIYDNGKLIGSAKVETPLDIISYISLDEKSIADFAKSYYRVVAEN